MSFHPLGGVTPRPPARRNFGTKENDPVLLLHTVRLWDEICSILEKDGPEKLTNEHRDVLRWLVDWGSYVQLTFDGREEIRLRNGLRLEFPKYGDLPKSSKQFLNTVFAHWREPHENY